jgi:hypothetical protein
VVLGKRVGSKRTVVFVIFYTFPYRAISTDQICLAIKACSGFNPNL